MSDKNSEMIDACPDDAVLFDIGANRGAYTTKMASKPRSKVYAFEPEPENLKKLREAVKDRPNVEVHGIALSDHVGVEKLMLHPTNPGGHSIHEALCGQKWKHTKEFSMDIGVMTLDEWCEQNGITRVDGIKIDVEAHEGQVLSGAKETLKRYHPIIAMETHNCADLELCKKTLKDCGYEVPELGVDRAYLLRVAF